MEGTEEGLLAAAATRELLKRKREELDGEERDKKTDGSVTAVAEAAPARPAPALPAIARPPPSCTHHVSTPKDYSDTFDPHTHGTLLEPKWTGTMAKTYPFTLDPFQSTSIACLERKESVMVAAHTSAGKTVVAEYAVAMAFRDKQRVIYTSPLKALSNQKYREFCDEFDGDVGLMTGDVTLHPNSTCIVMTTEILRSMIYRGSEILREVAWVVFDEVHYMQDRERGVVWEETIIFLPKTVKMVFLSATLSNAKEFTEWIVHLRRQPCHVVYTDYRPTPLQHYAFPLGGSGLYLIKDEVGTFRTDNFQRMRRDMGQKDEDGDGAGAAKKSKPWEQEDGGRKELQRRKPSKESMSMDIFRLVSVIKDRGLEPVIVFSFSRRECEQYALSMQKLDFNTAEEKDAIDAIFNNAIQCLSEEDQKLPAIAHILPMLRRGIAIHHSGLLPILKELIEILFQEGLIKCLFATETFAMGLNMPARTVVFTALQKWDGQQNRFMQSGEYIQMSGRAGRRGKDDRGLAIMMADPDLTREAAEDIVAGKPNPLLSSFRLSYYTLLNITRRMEGSGHDLEYVIQNSFQQFQHEKSLETLESSLQGIEARQRATEQEALGFPAPVVDAYLAARREWMELESKLASEIIRPQRSLSFLKPGRLVLVKEAANDWGWGVVVSVLRRGGERAEKAAAPGTVGTVHDYTVDCLLHCANASGKDGRPVPPGPRETGVMHVVPVALNLLKAISTLRITIPTDLRPVEARQALLSTLLEATRRLGGTDKVPRLDALDDMNIDDPIVRDVATRIKEVRQAVEQSPLHEAAQNGSLRDALEQRARLAAEHEALVLQMKSSTVNAFKAEAKSRRGVLQKLGHLDGDGLVTLKGRAACEIDTADELLTSELMFNGCFNTLDKHQIVALASCLVPVDKSMEEVSLTRKLAGPLQQLQDTARHIVEVSRECKLELDEEEYVDSFRPSLMDVVFAWSNGASFADVCKLTDIFEGSIIRAVRRLDELMNQLRSAAEAVGDVDLARKFEEGQKTIHRDIMFANSLYL